MVRLTPVNGPLSLAIVGDLPVGPALAAEIDAIWAEASRLRPHLFDGPAVSLAGIEDGRLTLVRSSYRHLFASRHDPAIAARLKLRPLAVTGILSCPQGLVFGLRGAEVTEGSGTWELVPSGGVTVPDLEAQILEELEEEIGLVHSQVTVLPPAALMESKDGGAVDVVMPLVTALTAEEIAALHRKKASREYAELLTCPVQDPRLEDLPLLPETHAIIAALSGSTPGTWRFPTQNPA